MLASVGSGEEVAQCPVMKKYQKPNLQAAAGHQLRKGRVGSLVVVENIKRANLRTLLSLSSHSIHWLERCKPHLLSLQNLSRLLVLYAVYPTYPAANTIPKSTNRISHQNQLVPSFTGWFFFPRFFLCPFSRL